MLCHQNSAQRTPSPIIWARSNSADGWNWPVGHRLLTPERNQIRAFRKSKRIFSFPLTLFFVFVLTEFQNGGTEVQQRGSFQFLTWPDIRNYVNGLREPVLPEFHSHFAGQSGSDNSGVHNIFIFCLFFICMLI